MKKYIINQNIFSFNQNVHYFDKNVLSFYIPRIDLLLQYIYIKEKYQ